jgi:Replication-relaxation
MAEYPQFMFDMTTDRLISRKQLIRRYTPTALKQVQKLIKEGLIEQHIYRPNSISNHVYHLSSFGRALMSDQFNIPMAQIPYTRGIQNQTMHTLWVGEVRWRLAKRGLNILPDYQNLVQCFGKRQTGCRPDMYILEDGRPVIAVEIDLSIPPSIIKQKVSEWKHEGLRVWWYVSGRKQAERLYMYCENHYGYGFDAFHNLDKTNWQPVYSNFEKELKG